MKSIIERFKKQFGYEPTKWELLELYTSGELFLTDVEEDAMVDLLRANQ